MAQQELNTFADHVPSGATNVVGQEDGGAGGKFDVNDILALGSIVSGVAQSDIDFNGYNAYNMTGLYVDQIATDFLASNGNPYIYASSSIYPSSSNQLGSFDYVWNDVWSTNLIVDELSGITGPEIQCHSNLLDSTGSYTLGDSSYYWYKAYLNNIYTGGIQIDGYSMYQSGGTLYWNGNAVQTA